MPASASTLCKRCTALLSGKDSISQAEIGNLRFKTDKTQIESREGRNCEFCIKIRDSLVSSEYAKDPMLVLSFKELNMEMPKLQLYNDDINTIPIKTFLVYADPGNVASSFVKTPPINLNPSSDISFERVEKWLDNCNTSHRCWELSGKTMPRRLLEVHASGNPNVKLIDTQQGKSYNFVALSYVWGLGNATTTQANLADRKKGTLIKDLPRTIQDVIFCARKLKLGYIWVDALCLVQDDKNERAIEIDRMKDFYRASYLTISAGVAEGCQEGFLSQRKDYVPLIELPIRTSDGKAGSVLLEDAMEPNPRFSILPTAEPINTRAWTLQESLLSCRMLIYSRLQLYWLCQERFARDGGSLSWQTFKNLSAWPFLKLEDFQPPVNVNTHPVSEKLRLKLHKTWIDLVMTYSGRSISYQSDKLPAVSAISALYHNSTRDEHICGLWRSALLFDLMWKRAADENPVNPRDTTKYAGPSWSWISYNGLVSYRGNLSDNRKAAVNVKSYTVTSQNSKAPFGEINPGAKLVLEAPLLQVPAASKARDVPGAPGSQFDPIMQLSNVIANSSCPLVADFTPDYLKVHQQNNSGPFWCLPIYSTGTGSGANYVAEKVNGIVLKKRQTGAGEQYYRVGVFQSYAHGWRSAQRLEDEGCQCDEKRPANQTRNYDLAICKALLSPKAHEVEIY